MFIDILFSIEKDLKEHNKDRNTMMSLCVEERLNKSLSTYYKELSNSINYLEYKDSLRVMKKINKE